MPIILDGDLGITTPALTVTGATVNTGGISTAGNLTFTSTGNRITGDFSNATIANRVLFQSSTTNGATQTALIPNGTATASAIEFYNGSDPANAQVGQLLQNATEFRISATYRGTPASGSYLPMTLNTGGSERMRIDSSGNVGIGTTSPTQKLDVTGNIKFGNTTSAPIFILNNTSVGSWKSEMLFQNSGTSKWAVGVDINANGNNNFYWYDSAASAERMRIDSAGSVMIGTTSSDSKLKVVGTISNANVGIATFQSATAADTSSTGISIVKSSNDSTTSQVFVRFGINNYSSGCGQINGNGSGAAAFGAFSDIRLKENIVELSSQLANITALRPVEFDYKTGGHQIGFIAQEIKEIYPDVVGEDNEGMLTVTGWSKTEARLVKAIQEQQALIEQLTTRLNALEGK